MVFSTDNSKISGRRPAALPTEFRFGWDLDRVAIDDAGRTHQHAVASDADGYVPHWPSAFWSPDAPSSSWPAVGPRREGVDWPSCEGEENPRAGPRSIEARQGKALRCQRRRKNRPRGGAKAGHWRLSVTSRAPWRARSPDSWRVPWRVGPQGQILQVVRCSAAAFSGAALAEPVAVAVHLEDVDVVGQPVEQRAGEALGAEGLGPFVEGQVAGDQGGAALVALGDQSRTAARRRSWRAARSRVRR